MWIAWGVTFSLKCSFAGSPVIVGSGWCGHWLNDDDPNALNNHCLSFGMLSAVGLNGICVGLAGVAVRLEQVHVPDVLAADVWLFGNDSLTILRSFIAVCER